MMNKVILILAGLAGLLLTVSGLRWFVEPGAAASAINMPLLDGLARSSQIGDLSAFFLVGGLFAFLGFRQAHWMWVPAALVGLAAIGRILAWQLQGADLAANLIVVELIMCAVFVAARFRNSRV